jgi:hypothetical protein
MNTITTTQDTPLTLAAIQQFRTLLDIMEDFIRNTEDKKLSDLSAINCNQFLVTKEENNADITIKS